MSPTTDGSKDRQHDAGGTDAEQPAHGRAGVLSMSDLEKLFLDSPGRNVSIDDIRRHLDWLENNDGG
jgi:hypothetical protein